MEQRDQPDNHLEVQRSGYPWEQQKITWWQELIEGKGKDKAGKTGWVQVAEVFEWHRLKKLFYSISKEEILKAKLGQ